MSKPELLTTALEAVYAACRLCMAVQHDILARDFVQKDDRSPVTVADLGGQALINRRLLARFPTIPIVGEESTLELERDPQLAERVVALVEDFEPGITPDQTMEAISAGASEPNPRGKFWTLDPIDGTKGFLRGDQYAVALALIENGTVILGILGCPNVGIDMGKRERGALFHAEKGQGSWLLPMRGAVKKQITVDGTTDPAGARFCESVESGHASHDTHAKISSELGITQAPYRIDSQAKYAAVARGDASIYLRLTRTRGYREKIWDHAAGSIIVEEAGGRVTDFSGKSLDFSRGERLEKNEGILATNGVIHDSVLSAISTVVKTG